LTPERYYEKLCDYSDQVLSDSRWKSESDDLGLYIFGMVSYGYALALGRFVLMLDIDVINRGTSRWFSEKTGLEASRVDSLISIASVAAFNSERYPVENQLIGLGHRFIGEADSRKIVDTVYDSIQNQRGSKGDQ